SVAGEDVRSAAVGFDGPGESVSRLVDERAVLESFKLCLSFRSGADGLSGAIAYDAAAYAADGIDRLSAALPGLIEAAALTPASPVQDLPIVSEAERHRILESWNPAPSEFPRDRTVLDLFEERARAAPESPAVSAAGKTLSYAELDARAGRL